MEVTVIRGCSSAPHARAAMLLGALACSMLVVALATGSPALAAPSGRELLDEAKRLNDTSRAWNDSSQRLAIVIHDADGRERKREMVIKTRRDHDAGDKSLSVFLEPPEVRGTAFLQVTHAGRDAEQWIYFPEGQRVRQIGGSSKDDSFMGSNFSYRDLELMTELVNWTADDADAKVLAVTDQDGMQVHSIELVPHKEDVGYKRFVLLLSTPDHVQRGIEFYSDGSEPKKVLRLTKIETIDGIPTPLQLEMKTPSGGYTVVDVSDVRYNQNIDANVFTKRTLERALETVQ